MGRVREAQRRRPPGPALMVRLIPGAASAALCGHRHADDYGRRATLVTLAAARRCGRYWQLACGGA